MSAPSISWLSILLSKCLRARILSNFWLFTFSLIFKFTLASLARATYPRDACVYDESCLFPSVVRRIYASLNFKFVTHLINGETLDRQEAPQPSHVGYMFYARKGGPEVTEEVTKWYAICFNSVLLTD